MMKLSKWYSPEMGRSCHVMMKLSKWYSPETGRSCLGMIKLSKRRSPGRQKSMCFAAQGRLQGRAAKLLLVRWQSWHNIAIRLTGNG